MYGQPLNILLVEDDDVDAMAFQRHLSRSSLPAKIHRAVDGVDALVKLRDSNSGIENPLLIVLDLNMPRMSGHEFLSELRIDPLQRHQLVLVLTTSDAESDLLASYDKNVLGYVIKSHVGEKYEKLISLLHAYYGLVEFPRAKP